MTLGSPQAEAHPLHFHTAPGNPPGRRLFWTLMSAIRCLVIWPVVFSAVVMAFFLAAAIYVGDLGGLLFWPLATVVFTIVYALAVGLPLWLCAKRRRWYVRVVPIVLAVAPVVMIVGMMGPWAAPGVLVIALSIAVETTGPHRRWAVRTARRLVTARR